MRVIGKCKRCGEDIVLGEDSVTLGYSRVIPPATVNNIRSVRFDEYTYHRHCFNVAFGTDVDIVVRT